MVKPKPILVVDVRMKHDVVLARQRSRQIAGLIGFSHQDQSRISTAVSEIARNAYTYAKGGRVEFSIESPDDRESLVITVSDRGPGMADLETILDGEYVSRTGMGLGVIGAKRLMDGFDIRSVAGEGTTVVLRKFLPVKSAAITGPQIARIATELAKAAPENPIAEVQQQNRELLRTLEELRARQTELAQLNRELEDTNRGVVALYAELDERADYLQRANELKTRFLSNMSHEFRTPLNAILSLSRILLDRIDGDLSAEQEKQVGFIRKSAESLSELVNDLLDLARVEAGKIVVRPREFDVPGLFSTLRGMLRPMLVGNSVDLVFDEPVGLPLMNTDDAKVSQILRNFISNALKFTERGEVRVSAKLSEDREAVVFSVSDTGIGIAREDQERVFQEWAQIDNPLQQKARGAGLGLPLSRKLGELLGGVVFVESEPGIGSTFSASIPLVYRGAAEAPIAKHEVPAVLAGKVPVLADSILIVDDEEVSRHLLRGLLSSMRLPIFEASNAQEALKLARQVRPRAIVLDLLMPDVSGYELLLQLRSDPATTSIPVIVNTSKVLSESERDLLAADTVEIVNKQSNSQEEARSAIQAALVKAGITPQGDVVH
jgi:signal transduction histidine kinase